MFSVIHSSILINELYSQIAFLNAILNFVVTTNAEERVELVLLVNIVPKILNV